MKLLRYGPAGSEKPGLLDKDGIIRDLSGVVGDIAGAALSDEGLKTLAALDPASLPKVAGNPRLGPCVSGTGKFIGIGLNFADHAAETNMPLPSEPIFFMKATSCIVGPNDDVMKPRDSTKMDWEVELGFVIGKKASYVSEAEALDYVAGFCLVNDVSEREFQVGRPGGQWDKGKGCDTFGFRSAPGSSPRMRSATPTSSPCGSRSTASAIRTATATRWCSSRPSWLPISAASSPCIRVTSSPPARRRASAWARSPIPSSSMSVT